MDKSITVPGLCLELFLNKTSQVTY
jgi:hypothetical protein